MFGIYIYEIFTYVTYGINGYTIEQTFKNILKKFIAL